MYQVDLDNLNKTVLKAAEIIQGNFLLLRSMGAVDKPLHQNLLALGKLMTGRRNVKFYDQEVEANASDEQPDAPDEAIVHNMMDLTDLCNEADGQSPLVMKKRFNDLNGGDEEHETESKKSKNAAEPEPFEFQPPKAVKSINFNAVAPVSSTQSHDLNITFDLNAIPAAEPKVLSEKLNKPGSSSSSVSSTSSAASKGETIRRLLRFCCENLRKIDKTI